MRDPPVRLATCAQHVQPLKVPVCEPVNLILGFACTLAFVCILPLDRSLQDLRKLALEVELAFGVELDIEVTWSKNPRVTSVFSGKVHHIRPCPRRGHALAALFLLTQR